MASLSFDVAVVIPLFNKARFIRRTLESVLSQTHAAAEIVIVDDGSTDGSSECIADLLDGRVRLISQPNAGPGPARNRGIGETRQPWIAFIDGDDLWRPDHLASLGRIRAGVPGAAVLATGYERQHGDLRRAPPGAPSSHQATIFDLFQEPLATNPLHTACVCVSRAAIDAAGGFGSFCPGEDFELWARLALDNQIAVSREPTAIYLRGTDGIMDRFEGGPRAGFVLQPIFATLDRALADPRYAAKHGAIVGYRDAILRQNVRQALYGGAPSEARAYARLMSRSELGMLRPLSLLPAPILRLGMRARAALRRNG